MNKRIKELAKLAGGEHYISAGNQTPAWYFKYDDCEKFAELIVRECTDILSTYRAKIIFEDGIEYNGVHPIQAIQKHFGVE